MGRSRMREKCRQIHTEVSFPEAHKEGADNHGRIRPISFIYQKSSVRF
jgi:hypothetical protein